MKKNSRLFLIAFIFLAGLPVLTSWGIYKHLENRLEIKIRGQFLPVPFAPVFYLKNAQFQWNGKVHFENGHLKVSYNPFSFLSSRGVRVRLTGGGLQVQLLGDWAKMQGVEKAALERFKAEFSVGANGINEIYCVEVQSPAFQFNLKETDQ